MGIATESGQRFVKIDLARAASSVPEDPTKTRGTKIMRSFDGALRATSSTSTFAAIRRFCYVVGVWKLLLTSKH